MNMSAPATVGQLWGVATVIFVVVLVVSFLLTRLVEGLERRIEHLEPTPPLTEREKRDRARREERPGISSASEACDEERPVSRIHDRRHGAYPDRD